MNKPVTLLGLVLLVLAAAQPCTAQRLVTAAARPSAARPISQNDFPGQIRPAEEVAEAAPASAPALGQPDAVAASDLELAHLQYIKNKVSLGMPLTKSESLFIDLWKLRFPPRPRPTK